MNIKKWVFNILFLVVVIYVTFTTIFKGQDLDIIIKHIASTSPIFWIIGVACVAAFVFGESIVIYYMLKEVGQEVKIARCYVYSFVGFFFSCITPSASGGQPAQIYFMKKDNIPIPVATIILMIVTITYKMVLVVTGVLVAVIRPAEIMHFLEPVWFWCCLGIALNVFCVTFMLILVFHPTLATDIVVKGIRICEKIFRLKKADKYIAKFQISMEKYKDVAVYLSEHKLVMSNVMIITVIQRYILFFITYLTYRSFDLAEIGAVTITVLQGMISVSVDMLPLPGGMGISESLFISIFRDIFGENILLPAMIVSRGLSYYIQTTLSAIVTVFAYFALGRRKQVVSER